MNWLLTRSGGAWRQVACLGLLLFLMASPAGLTAMPAWESNASVLRVTGADYRVTCPRHSAALQIELRTATGAWRPVTKQDGMAEFGVSEDRALHTTGGNPARLEHAAGTDCLIVGITTLLAMEPPRTGTIHLLCADEGLLVSFSVSGPGADGRKSCWALPRLPLDLTAFDGFTFWREPDEPRTGPIAGLGERDAYAGAGAWGAQGDTAQRLSQRHPAVIARAGLGAGLGVVFLRYAEDWAGTRSFLQRHTAQDLLFYPAIASCPPDTGPRWAWLAPFAGTDPGQTTARVERLLARGEALRRSFRAVAPEPDPAWFRRVPDFDAALRRKRPVSGIREAVVYTVHETMNSDEGIRAAAKVGSDVWIRAWFKWHQAPDFAAMAHLVPKAHDLGALFGGGITCSALYEGENGLADAAVHAMATRGPDGRLVDAWGQRGCRHGSLSNPAYLSYLLGWCRNQIDAGVDYLFMDEINAALQGDEGFDDFSIRDFQAHLLRVYCKNRGWSRNDPRWRTTFKVALDDREVSPDGTIASLAYRDYLRKNGLALKPHDRSNPLAAEWRAFRRQRDDRAWKWLTDAIRSHAAGKGRRVLLSGNGLARYVDLQVLGVWGLWRVRNDGTVDLERSQLDDWASTVAAGRSLAGAPVPVVFFHDWGFNGFPWMEVRPAERELWMRVRGAEIYAAGGFFAFPMHGPCNNDALRDGTVAEVARQTAFYQRNRGLYLDARLLGFEPLETASPLLSTALWRREGAQPALLLHVINRQAAVGKPVPRQQVEVQLPTRAVPRRVRVVSPDWEGERSGEWRTVDGRVVVTIPVLEAYAVATLDYDRVPEVAMAGVKTVPVGRWEAQEQNEFVVEPGGAVRDGQALPAFLHGELHSAHRNPLSFLVCMPAGGKLRVQIRSVATLGAKLECLVDGSLTRSFDLPDLDRRNDAGAAEYERVLEFEIPPGRHRVTLRNEGGDWAYVAWYAFAGEVARW